MRTAGGTPAAVVSNGSIGLVVWSDDRSGFPEAFATRVSPDGVALDPLGINLGSGLIRHALWNGEQFAVVTVRGASLEMVFVDPSGNVADRKVLDLPVNSWAAAVSRPGDAPRVLFLRWDFTSAQSVVRYSVIDGRGNVVARDIRLPAPEGSDSNRDHRWAVGAGPNEFLIFRLQQPTASGGWDHIIADRISLEGQILSSKNAGIGTYVDFDYGVAGTADGYVLVSPVPYGTAERRVWFFDREGVYSGQSTLLASPEPAQPGPAILAHDGERVFATWTTPRDAQGRAISYVARVDRRGIMEAPRAILYEKDALQPPLLGTIGGRRYAFFNNGQLMAVQLADDLTPGAMSLLATAGAAQRLPAVGASGHGFAVAWLEDGKGVQVRRYNAAGTPVGEPTSFGAEWARRIAVTSNGSTYLIAAQGDTTVRLRRMSAATGEWLEDAPLAVTEGGLALASNGNDVLMAWPGRCPDGRWQCANVRIIPMTGPLQPSEPRVAALPQTAGDVVGEVSLASSGRDYLLSWIDSSPPCPFLCAIDPFVVRAMRINQAGEAAGAPIEIESRKSYGSRLSSAWDGNAYVVAWLTTLTVRGARVRSDDSVERSAMGEAFILDTADDPRGAIIGFVTQHANGVLLFTREQLSTVEPATAPWRVVTIPAATPLPAVDALRRTALRAGDAQTLGAIAAASSGPLILLAYDRPAPEVGGSPRLYTRGLWENLRRRAAAR
jgi:hypothetical protein